MISYSKILGTIFAFGILIIAIIPTLNIQANAIDLDLSDFRCIAQAGVIGDNFCNNDNRSGNFSQTIDATCTATNNGGNAMATGSDGAESQSIHNTACEGLGGLPLPN
jgi:hypothetical protein